MGTDNHRENLTIPTKHRVLWGHHKSFGKLTHSEITRSFSPRRNIGADVGGWVVAQHSQKVTVQFWGNKTKVGGRGETFLGTSQQRQLIVLKQQFSVGPPLFETVSQVTCSPAHSCPDLDIFLWEMGMQRSLS